MNESQEQSTVVDLKNVPKFIQKRMKNLEKRKKELKDKGLSDEEVEQTLAREEYESLPINEKVTRLERMVAETTQNFAKEINNLFYNDQLVADYMDINMRSVARIFAKLNVSVEEQKKITMEVQEELENERKAKKTEEEASAK